MWDHSIMVFGEMYKANHVSGLVRLFFDFETLLTKCVFLICTPLCMPWAGT